MISTTQKCYGKNQENTYIFPYLSALSSFLPPFIVWFVTDHLLRFAFGLGAPNEGETELIPIPFSKIIQLKPVKKTIHLKSISKT